MMQRGEGLPRMCPGLSPLGQRQARMGAPEQHVSGHRGMRNLSIPGMASSGRGSGKRGLVSQVADARMNWSSRKITSDSVPMSSLRWF